MSRSPFSRSPHHSSQPTFTRHGHSSSSSEVRLDSSSPPPSAQDVHRSMSTSMATRGMRRLEARRVMEESNFLTCKARNLNPPVDMRMLDYIIECDSNLMCPICRCPFVDPVVLTECDHCFCRDCIRQTWTTSTSYTPLGPRGDCPTCRTPAKLGARNATSKILVNILDDLLVKCPKSDEGCKAEVKRGEVQDHINIYCGFAYIECVVDECEFPVRRKDAAQGCLHYAVSCMDCREEMQKSNLEQHWRSECKDRKAPCSLCREQVFVRELDFHSKESCPAISIPCPGAAFGCTARSKRTQADVHAKSCTFAKLAPILSGMRQRIDDQEQAQKQMSRKLEILEQGFAGIQDILDTKEGIVEESADESRIPFLQQSSHRRTLENAGESPRMDSMIAADPDSLTFPELPTTRSPNSPTTPRPMHTTASLRPSRVAPGPPGPRPADLPEPYSSDFDLASPYFPPPATNGGPYASPLHHLLSMHETLRDEITRISSALQELDGRHSMQILNENLRMREEMSYFGAQVGGLQRQVHWLTSAQLQREHRPTATPSASGAGTRAASDIAGTNAGSSVEAAVSAMNTAASAMRGSGRMVNMGQGMRRGLSEEGRTKL